MDIVLNYCDQYFFTPYVYPASWPEDYMLRQFISLLTIANTGGYVLYFLTASASYLFLFDRELMKHPKFLENQVRKEIIYTCKSLPLMGVLTAAVFLFEVLGYTKLYDDLSQTRFGYWSVPINVVAFILFTDMGIYWIHRFLHHRFVYKHIHKAHHKWLVPTPFASHAFHPIDGFLQSCPYHIYPFLIPLHKWTYLALFVFVNVWTVSIHDGDFRVPSILKPLVNGSAHHTDHHLFYNYNYGQFFTLWDRIGGSFKYPSAFEGKGPKDELKNSENGVLPTAAKGAKVLDRVLRHRTATSN